MPGAGDGKIAYVLDFEGYTNANAAPLRVSLHCNHILSHHFPERMGVAVIYHAPTLFSVTWTVRLVVMGGTRAVHP